MGIGLFLLSRLTEHTSVLVASLYMIVLGAGIGLCMQVLTLIVQNTSSYQDLGVATSGVTFFRTLGSSFGASVFGSLYVNFLGQRLPAAIAASPGRRTRPSSEPRRRCIGSRRPGSRRSSTPTRSHSRRSTCGRSRSRASGCCWR